ncbi:sulfite exporter TauE/SafE family protein [Adhaeribacter sp. BT258]|uniref:Probable membrane transporter protein n=1 Tax=Adhaeribacter terrigena TaxID=2793070 RepID=A0ABS1C3H6_9BACT|nr:sulfite exporter TauE/SafE family protein [Adhaeribacter terrigena]MBK0403951.1 sulfite exporter TauE/SafE family protein [Adhaeribacter terrigena]
METILLTDFNTFHLVGYLAAILIGVSLGLVGGGGSILTVPVLVYLIGINPVVSTSYSLFVVGLTSLVGAATYMKRKLINYRTAIVFSIPSFISVFLTRKFLVPAIPEVIFENADFIIYKEHFIMVLFAGLMTVASYAMIRQKPLHGHTLPNPKVISYRFIWALGAILGVLTGTVGAGGGFLIIPALILFAGLEMKTAIGTSLLIIAINSLIGFTGDISTHHIDWIFLGGFSSLAIGGILTGTYVSTFVPGQTLKPAFGWFVLLMGCGIIAKEMLQF